MKTDVIDLLYEAALIPERWSDVLDAVGTISGSQSNSLFVFSPRFAPRGISTNMTSDLIADFLNSDEWRTSPSVRWTLDTKPAAFTSVDHYLSPEVSAADKVWMPLAERGFGQRLASVVPIPSGESVVFVLARLKHTGAYRAPEIAALDALRPHLSRAGLVASRLGLERARAMVETLERIGLAAAVIAPSGKVIATNPLLDGMSNLFVATAFGGIALADRARNSEFQDTIPFVADKSGSARSIAMPGNDAHPPLILHLLPVRGQAQDIFSGGNLLMIVSTLTRKATPQPELLYGLFDLSPAETRLVGALLTGATLHEISARHKLSIATLRTQMRSVLAKTGVRRQAELTQLLATL
jgi:DNA-binding CsgD family transcriptional regulator